MDSAPCSTPEAISGQTSGAATALLSHSHDCCWQCQDSPQSPDTKTGAVGTAEQETHGPLVMSRVPGVALSARQPSFRGHHAPRTPAGPAGPPCPCPMAGGPCCSFCQWNSGPGTVALVLWREVASACRAGARPSAGGSRKHCFLLGPGAWPLCLTVSSTIRVAREPLWSAGKPKTQSGPREEGRGKRPLSRCSGRGREAAAGQLLPQALRWCIFCLLLRAAFLLPAPRVSAVSPQTL